MKWLIKWFFRIAFLLIVLVVVAVLSLNSILKALVERQIRSETGMDATIGKFSMVIA